MLHIEFEYKDKHTGDRWVRQSCVMRSVRDCIRWYGLGIDCDYRIINVTEA